MAELVVRASFANEGNAPVRLDCRERIVGDLDWGESSSCEEGRLANVREADRTGVVSDARTFQVAVGVHF